MKALKIDKGPHARLLQQNLELRAELLALRHKIDYLESQVAGNLEPQSQLKDSSQQKSLQGTAGRLDASGNTPDKGEESSRTSEGFRWKGEGHSLTRTQVEKYSRQILLQCFGAKAQWQLSKSSVVVVGAGGLGCPGAIYLASAGVGKLGIVDKDSVENSNLHRQILHTEAAVGVHKAESAAAACRAINSTIQVVSHKEALTASNALALFEEYDLVLDASDNAPTRYLISDACAVLGKPLVSGAAIGTDGQLTVYCHEQGPCYRCLYPEPPKPESCSRCSEAGVLGPVPGLIGTLQALEAIKILTGVGSIMSQRLLVADFLAGRFSVVKLRGRQVGCKACGDQPAITRETLPSFDYAEFTGQQLHDGAEEELQLLPSHKRVGVESFLDWENPVLDVRPLGQFQAAHLPGSLSIPFDEHKPQDFVRAWREVEAGRDTGWQTARPVCVVCRRGNDSQRVVEILERDFATAAVDLQGGLLALSHAGAGFPLL